MQEKIFIDLKPKWSHNHEAAQGREDLSYVYLSSRYSGRCSQTVGKATPCPSTPATTLFFPNSDPRAGTALFSGCWPPVCIWSLLLTFHFNSCLCRNRHEEFWKKEIESILKDFFCRLHPLFNKTENSLRPHSKNISEKRNLYISSN